MTGEGDVGTADSSLPLGGGGTGWGSSAPTPIRLALRADLPLAGEERGLS